MQKHTCILRTAHAHRCIAFQAISKINYSDQKETFRAAFASNLVKMPLFEAALLHELRVCLYVYLSTYT